MHRLLGVVFTAMLLSSCASLPERDRNTLTDAGIGAGVGALIGSATGGPGGTLVGAAIGGATGGVIGYMVRPEGCFILNMRGEVWRVPCEGRHVRAEACYVGNEIVGFTQVACPSWRRYR